MLHLWKTSERGVRYATVFMCGTTQQTMLIHSAFSPISECFRETFRFSMKTMLQVFMKKIAILQSNYIPWKGYFDMIAAVDEFIFYDEMQYTTHDWRNRNKIKTQKGLTWISIPVNSKGHLTNKLRIVDAEISNSTWANTHWSLLKQVYGKTPGFKLYKDLFGALYEECATETYLCNVNYKFIRAINDILGIKTKLSFSHNSTSKL